MTACLAENASCSWVSHSRGCRNALSLSWPRFAPFFCLGFIAAVTVKGLDLNRAWSMIQKDTVSNWQLFVEPGHSGWSFLCLILLTLLVRSYAANSLAWLAWKADGLLGGEWGLPAHAHLAQKQGVELTHFLSWGFSKKKDRFGRRPLWLRLSLGFRREQTKGSLHSKLGFSTNPSEKLIRLLLWVSSRKLKRSRRDPSVWFHCLKYGHWWWPHAPWRWGRVAWDPGDGAETAVWL